MPRSVAAIKFAVKQGDGEAGQGKARQDKEVAPLGLPHILRGPPTIYTATKAITITTANTRQIFITF